jgi:hypothetical protein
VISTGRLLPLDLNEGTAKNGTLQTSKISQRAVKTILSGLKPWGGSQKQPYSGSYSEAYQLLGLMLFCSLVGLAAALGVLRLNQREQAQTANPGNPGMEAD